jgi:hypothetical protein
LAARSSVSRAAFAVAAIETARVAAAIRAFASSAHS